MKLNMEGYLKLGSAGGIAGVFITDPLEDIPNALTDETGAFLLDEYGRNLIAEE